MFMYQVATYTCSMLIDIGLKFYAVPSQPTCVTLTSRSWVIDFDRFSGKAQVRRAMLSCDSSYYFFVVFLLKRYMSL